MLGSLGIWNNIGFFAFGMQRFWNVYAGLLCRILRWGACEMAQQVEACAAKSKDLCLSPKTHMVEGENRFPKDVL